MCTLYGEQGVNSIPTWKLSEITLAYISELIKLQLKVLHSK